MHLVVLLRELGGGGRGQGLERGVDPVHRLQRGGDGGGRLLVRAGGVSGEWMVVSEGEEKGRRVCVG